MCDIKRVNQAVRDGLSHKHTHVYKVVTCLTAHQEEEAGALVTCATAAQEADEEDEGAYSDEHEDGGRHKWTAIIQLDHLQDARRLRVETQPDAQPQHGATRHLGERYTDVVFVVNSIQYGTITTCIIYILLTTLLKQY